MIEAMEGDDLEANLYYDPTDAVPIPRALCQPHLAVTRRGEAARS